PNPVDYRLPPAAYPGRPIGRTFVIMDLLRDTLSRPIESGNVPVFMGFRGRSRGADRKMPYDGICGPLKKTVGFPSLGFPPKDHNGAEKQCEADHALQEPREDHFPQGLPDARFA